MIITGSRFTELSAMKCLTTIMSNVIHVRNTANNIHKTDQRLLVHTLTRYLHVGLILFLTNRLPTTAPAESENETDQLSHKYRQIEDTDTAHSSDDVSHVDDVRDHGRDEPTSTETAGEVTSGSVLLRSFIYFTCHFALNHVSSFQCCLSSFYYMKLPEVGISAS